MFPPNSKGCWSLRVRAKIKPKCDQDRKVSKFFKISPKSLNMLKMVKYARFPRAFQKWLQMTKNGHSRDLITPFSPKCYITRLERHYKKSNKYQSLGEFPPKLTTKMSKASKITNFWFRDTKVGVNRNPRGLNMVRMVLKVAGWNFNHTVKISAQSV